MIRRVSAWQVVDSRGNPTVLSSVETESTVAYAAAPSGASTGSHEVVPFASTVAESVRLVNTEVDSSLKGKNERNQTEVDKVLHEVDGTDDFSRIGGNAAIAVSMAVLRAAAAGFGKEVAFYLNPQAKAFPYPLGNAIGGGAHGGGTDIQEFLIIPAGAKSYPEAVSENSAMHKLIKEKLKSADPHFLSSRNDEGAWACALTAEKIFDILSSVIDEIDADAKIGLDVAATEFFKDGSYVYSKQGMKLSQGEQIDYLVELARKYPIAYIEDPLHEDDFSGFAELMSKVDCLVCGDDLTVTNTARLLEAVEKKSCNSMIVKPNQIGTITQTLDVVEKAKENGVATVLSHRSGETCDNTIAHLALASESLLLKTGIVGGERVAKHNELIRLWDNNKKMVKL